MGERGEVANQPSRFHLVIGRRTSGSGLPDRDVFERRDDLEQYYSYESQPSSGNCENVALLLEQRSTLGEQNCGPGIRAL
ncbi:hypothetical protein PHSY_007320 [Pseudozyma hubeiensis SY62]|uniref:Uncharacterized protein n=1 Tax=Pseudozyma hubeiensis (strain SY62) TaxID=1305764 RepID=R9PEN2_PSEHS|nr:hypothetical protein PHSY_007320 [Pseudozyma hubeiensis SY62]GAC99717.1 hypothetical protein PHSY_007320 [Pseudozyma hubeiensis SY62]